MLKIAQFLRAGCKITILLADIHGFLDNLKAPIELVKFRAQYYRHVITELLKAVNVPTDQLNFRLGSDYQLTPEYTMDLFRLSSIVTEHDAKKAGAEVVKQVENATLSGLIYPLMQALDEEYLGVDAQFGGVDQRKIFALAKEVLPKVGMRERAHLMNPMVPGLQGGKMSASDPDSKIDLLDAPDAVRRKLKKAPCVPKQAEDNGILSFIEYVLLPAGELRYGKPQFTVSRREGEGEPLVYEDIKKMRDDYAADIVSIEPLRRLFRPFYPFDRYFSPDQLVHKLTQPLPPSPYSSPHSYSNPLSPKPSSPSSIPSRRPSRPHPSGRRLRRRRTRRLRARASPRRIRRRRTRAASTPVAEWRTRPLPRRRTGALRAARRTRASAKSSWARTPQRRWES